MNRGKSALTIGARNPGEIAAVRAVGAGAVWRKNGRARDEIAMSRRECLESLAVVEGVKLLAERAAKDEDQVGGRAEEVKVELVGEASKRRLSPGFAARATLLSRARTVQQQTVGEREVCVGDWW